MKVTCMALVSCRPPNYFSVNFGGVCKRVNLVGVEKSRRSLGIKLKIIPSIFGVMV